MKKKLSYYKVSSAHNPTEYFCPKTLFSYNQFGIILGETVPYPEQEASSPKGCRRPAEIPHNSEFKINKK